jgi:two-component system CheB/CheR fusion protein
MDGTRPPAGLRILLVDDSREMTQILAPLLAHWGYEVRQAHNGNNALEAADGFVPDVVLLDIAMPDMDGWEVVRRLRAQPELRETLCVAVTGLSSDDARRRSREAGFDHHLVKPVDPSELHAVLAAKAAQSAPPCP